MVCGCGNNSNIFEICFPFDSDAAQQHKRSRSEEHQSGAREHPVETGEAERAAGKHSGLLHTDVHPADEERRISLRLHLQFSCCAPRRCGRGLLLTPSN